MRWTIVWLFVAACVEHDPPNIERFAPSEGAELNGAGTVVVGTTVSDDSALRAELQVDGEVYGVIKRDGCSDGCTFQWLWDTSTTPAGDHELMLVIEDSHGNESSDAHLVRVDDMITVKSIEVKNIVDESGTLEIEVYLVDDATNQVYGCAGGRHGLSTVDASNVRYTVDATLVDRTIRPIGALSFERHAAHIEVWEDDDDPICPEPLDPAGNDLVGKQPSPMMFAPSQMMAFDNVVSLEIAMGRPLRLEDTPPPKEQPPGTGGFGAGGGCSTSGGASGFVLVLLMLTSAGRLRVLRRARRRRDS
jgi:hypothetical protein